MNPTLRDKSNKVTMKQRTWLSNSNFLLKSKKKKNHRGSNYRKQLLWRRYV